MKTILTILITLTFICTLLGQSDSDSLKFPGKKGIQFAIDEIRLHTIDGGLGAKYWLSDLNAFTVMVDLSIRKTETTNTESFYHRLGLTTGFEHHLYNTKVSPYIGLELGYNYGDKEELSKDFADTSSNSSNSYFTDHKVSLSLIFGVEYFFNNSISLSGYFKLTGDLLYHKNERIYNYRDSSFNEYAFYTLYTDVSKLILSVYF